MFGGPEELCKSPGVSQNLPTPLPLLPDHSSIVCVYLKAEAVSLGQYQDLQSAQSRDPLPRTGQHGAAQNETWQTQRCLDGGLQKELQRGKNKKGKMQEAWEEEVDILKRVIMEEC